MSKEMNVVSLQLIAALAGKAAMDVQHNRLWPNELSEVIAKIRAALDDVKEKP